MQRNAFLRPLFLLVAVLLLASVVHAAPAAFTLSTPTDTKLFKTHTALTSFTWTPSTGADTYNLYVMLISENTRIGEVLNMPGLTPGADSDALACTVSLCTYTLDGATQLMFGVNGRYAWNVEAVAAAEPGTPVEASNGPLFFTVNMNPIELLSNRGFEARTAKNVPTQVPWVGVQQTTSKIRCNTATVIYAYEGLCAFQLMPGGGAITQTVNKALILQGDSLSAKAAVKTGLSAAGTVVTINIVYVEPTAGLLNNGRDKLVISHSSSATGYVVLNSLPASLVVDGTPKTVKVTLRYNGTTKSVFLDDLSLLVSPPLP